jgi:phosphate-selective porin OprO/OprP
VSHEALLLDPGGPFSLLIFTAPSRSFGLSLQNVQLNAVSKLQAKVLAGISPSVGQGFLNPDLRMQLCTAPLFFIAAAVALLPEVASAQDQAADEAAAPTKDTASSLADLQAQIDALSEQLEVTPTLGSSRSSMKLFGRIHLDYWDFAESDAAINVFESGDPNEDPQNNIEFRRARIGVSGDVDESMLYKIELEFGHPNAFAFKDLYFGFKDLPAGQRVLIGNQKRPYGLDHLNSSRFNVFIERPFVIEAVNQDARRLGIAAYGLSEEKAWNWRYGVYNMKDWSKDGEYVGDRIQPEIAGRIANTAIWEDGGRKYAHWAVSGTLAFPDGDPALGGAGNEARFRTRPEARSQSRWLDTGRIAGAEDYQLVGLEGVWNDGPTQIVAEYMNTWLSRDSAEDVRFHGGYIQAAYFLTGEYMPWSRKSGTLARQKPESNFAPGAGWGAWQVALRYSYADFSDKDIAGGLGESVTLALNWYWNANSSVQLNYIRGDISERDEDVGGTIYSEGDYEVVGMRLRFDF